MCGREAAHESYKMKPQLKAQTCNVRLTPDQKQVLTVHQVRFCELRREGKLVVGAGRYEDQLQLKGLTIKCRVGCVTLHTSDAPGGEEGVGTWSGHSGPTWLGEFISFSLGETIKLWMFTIECSICNTHHDQPYFGVRKSRPGRNAC